MLNHNYYNKKNIKYFFNKIKNNKGKIKIDSREIKSGDIFITLKGKKNNGENYIEEALRKKARYVITEKFFFKYNKKIIQVDNCIKTLEFLAKNKRSCYDGKIIGITGSVGKTTTKEQLKHFLQPFVKTDSSIKSYNNNLGVNLSLANLNLNSEIMIIEIGTNNFGEVKRLTKIVKPNIAIITNIGPTHLKYFKNINNILKEKSHIFDKSINSELESIIIPGEGKISESLYKIAKKNLNTKLYTFGQTNKSNVYPNKITKLNNDTFLVHAMIFNKIKKFKISATGYHQIMNIFICILVFYIKNINFRLFSSNALSLPKLSGRGKVYKITMNRNKFKLIDETYNASPMSMESTIEYFSEYNTNNKILILGDMLELGIKSNFYHREIAKKLKLTIFKQVILCGKLIKSLYEVIKNNENVYYFSNKKRMSNHFQKYINNNDVVLAKCSNSTIVNNFIKDLKENKKGK